MRVLFNIIRSRKPVAIVATLVVALTTGVALAYFTGALATGSNAAAAAGSLPTGNTPTVGLTGANATVSWSQNTVGGQLLGTYSGGGYTIKRYPASGGSAVTPGSSCNTTISGSTSTLSCTESNVPAGSWKYTVTPVLNNWVGTESAQSAAISTGSISLNPTSGHVGDMVTISGSNFPANSAITATYDGAALTLSPASPSTDGSGNIPANVTFLVPASTAGAHAVKVTVSGQSATATFTVQPKITLNPSSGGAGSSDSIIGSGFAANSSITATFNSTSVTLSGTTSTDSSGSFTGANYTVPGTSAAGNYSVAVTDGSAGANTGSATFTVTFGPAAKIVLSTSSANLQSGATRSVSATIEDAAGNVVSGGSDATDSVTFSQTSGSGSVSGLGSASASGGVASITVTGNLAGAVTLQASAKLNGSSTATSSNTQSFTVTFGTASQVVLSGSTADLTSGTVRTLTATIEDSAGNTVTGGGDSSVSVNFAQSAGSGSVSGTGSATASGGVATKTVTGVHAGPVTMRASATLSGPGATNSNTLGFNVVPGAAATVAALSGSLQSATVTSAFASPLVAFVADSNGNPVPGVTVTFTAPSTGASGTFANSTVTTTAITDANGDATASTFTANTIAGTYSVSASAAGVASPTSFTLSNTAQTTNDSMSIVQGNNQSATVGTAFATALKVKIVDQFNNPVSGVTVTFTAPATGASGTFANSTATTSASTDSSGNATATTFTANTKAGSYSVTTSASGVASPSSFSLTNSPGALSKLVFTTQPGGATGGTAFTQQPVVTAEDANGNTITSYAGTASLSIKTGTGTSGASLSGCSGSRSNGVTTFSGCKIDKAGSNYQLTATDGTFSVDSSQFNVTVGTASQIALSGSTADLSSGSTRTFTATVEDAGGNTVSSGTDSTVSINFAQTGGTGSVTGTGNATASGGVATKTVTGNAAGSVTLQATATLSVPGATSSNTLSFNVTAGTTATKLVFTTQPGGASAGSAFVTQPVVTAEDNAGNTVSSFTGAVTLSIKSGTGAGNGTLTCTANPVNATSGVATFSGCAINKPGQGYILTATSGSLTVDSASFNVADVGKNLAFITQPGGTITGGTAFPTQPVVAVEDVNGNIVTNDTSTVSLTITGGTGTSGAALSGCSGSATNGVTTFSGCKIDKAGIGYKLTASDGNLTTATSNAFNVNVGSASQLALSAATTAPTAGTADNLTITAQDAGGNTVTGYTGSHNLTFSGANTAPDGTHKPTVTNSSGAAITFGNSTAINFTNGVASVTGGNNGVMTLYKAETASISVSDGSISNAASPLSVTVSIAASTPSGLTYNDGNATAGDTVTGSTSTNTSVKATETAGDHVGNTYTATSDSTGAFTIVVENYSQTPNLSFTYSVIAIDAFGNQTTAAPISKTDKN